MRSRRRREEEEEEKEVKTMKKDKGCFCEWNECSGKKKMRWKQARSMSCFLPSSCLTSAPQSSLLCKLLVSFQRSNRSELKEIVNVTNCKVFLSRSSTVRHLRDISKVSSLSMFPAPLTLLCNEVLTCFPNDHQQHG